MSAAENDTEPSIPKSEGSSVEYQKNAGPPPLPQGTAAPTFGGVALVGMLNQQSSPSSVGIVSSATPTGGQGGSTFFNTGATSTGGLFGGEGGGAFGSQPAAQPSGGGSFFCIGGGAGPAYGGAAQSCWRGRVGGPGVFGGPHTVGRGVLFGGGGAGATNSDEDEDTCAVPFGQNRPFGTTKAQQPNQPRGNV